MSANAAAVLSDLGYRRQSTGVPTTGRETLTASEALDMLTQIWIELVGLLDLPPNWDSYGARKISGQSIAATIDLVETIFRPDMPYPTVVPTSDGHVQIEWHERGIDLEIEVVSPTNIGVWYEDRRSQEPPTELHLDYDLTELHRLVHNLSIRSEQAISR